VCFSGASKPSIDVLIFSCHLQLATVGLKTAGYTSIVAVCAAAFSAFPGENYKTTLLSYSTALPLPSLSCLSLFTTLHSQRTVRDRVTITLASLDSFVVPASLRGDPSHLSPFPTRLSQSHHPGQQLEKEDWKPKVVEMEDSEESAPSKDSDRSPV
jgi:hypothetical protein